jgi:glyoxylase-like metal-dependent hydrolase (beta-lactamase superfamily II)
MVNGKVTVGNVEIIEFLDTIMDFPFEAFFPTIPAKDFEPYREAYGDCWAPDGRFRTNAQCFALRSQGRTILVDTGVGPGPHDWLGGARGHLMDEMKEKGVRPDEVETVVFTHLHVDHVGWKLSDGGNPRATFPKARYLVPQADWEAFSKPEMREQAPHIEAAVTPLRELGVMDLVSGERDLTGELTIVPTPGHTPGHMSIVVASAGERAMLTGDVAQHPAQIQEVEWCSGFDGDPDQARKTRRQVLDRLEQEGTLAIICHFPAPGFGRLVRLQGKRMWQVL